MLSGILKRECVVLLVGNIDAATPARAIKPLDHNVLKRVRYKYVFPVLPGPSMKKAPFLPCNIHCNIMSYAIKRACE